MMVRILAGLLLAGSALLVAEAAASQAPELPADLQLELIAKVLLFDRQAERYGDEITIGVLHQPRNRESARAARELADAVTGSRVTIGGVRLRIVPLPLTDERAPITIPREVDVLYLAPLRAVDVKEIIAHAARSGMLTVTAVEHQSIAGAALGLLIGDGRPRIRISRKAALLAGSQFSSQLLRLVEVIE